MLYFSRFMPATLLFLTAATVLLAPVTASAFSPFLRWDIRTSPCWRQVPAHGGCCWFHGSYLVLPILGPSTVRYTVGFAADTASFNLAGPAAWVDDTSATLASSGTSAVDKRHRIPFRYRKCGSPFECELLRMLYTMKRDYDIDN